ncbi:F-box/kelch-repeat protein At3g06240-like [Cornus florida]|uniref:F-box/kelch-repeat protein At3g06240-like n=1 Tax=Cornus florida TaxID=4283 RepID=UPI00289F4FB1|nr:F-box/kelch-repeat protein At3g06240-like [Cornus florida]
MAVLNLPRDIQMDILSRLPVESLLRFKCVSKQYRFLISDPYFIKLHLNRSIHSKNWHKLSFYRFGPQSIIDYESLFGNNNVNDGSNASNAVVKLYPPFLSPSSDKCITVIGSCNGLICYLIHYGLLQIIVEIILYNPSTRVYKKLPEPPHWIVGNFGFAYDSSNDDYKVLIAKRHFSDVIFKFCIFSLRDNSWRTMPGVDCNYVDIFSSSSCCLNGALHWLLKPRVIVCFDLLKEVFSEMSLDGIQGGNEIDLSFCKMGVLEECLYAVSASNGVNGRLVEIWLMKEYGVKASWSKFITIPCDVGTLCFTPLCLLRNGELVLKIHSGLLVDQAQLGSYNTKLNTFTKICDCPNVHEEYLYVESLVSPNSFDGPRSRSLSLSCGMKALMNCWSSFFPSRFSEAFLYMESLVSLNSFDGVCSCHHVG